MLRNDLNVQLFRVCDCDVTISRCNFGPVSIVDCSLTVVKNAVTLNAQTSFIIGTVDVLKRCVHVVHDVWNVMCGVRQIEELSPAVWLTCSMRHSWFDTVACLLMV